MTKVKAVNRLAKVPEKPARLPISAYVLKRIQLSEEVREKLEKMVELFKFTRKARPSRLRGIYLKHLLLKSSADIKFVQEIRAENGLRPWPSKHEDKVAMTDAALKMDIKVISQDFDKPNLYLLPSR